MLIVSSAYPSYLLLLPQLWYSNQQRAAFDIDRYAGMDLFSGIDPSNVSLSLYLKVAGMAILQICRPKAPYDRHVCDDNPFFLDHRDDLAYL